MTTSVQRRSTVTVLVIGGTSVLVAAASGSRPALGAATGGAGLIVLAVGLFTRPEIVTAAVVILGASEVVAEPAGVGGWVVAAVVGVALWLIVDVAWTTVEGTESAIHRRQLRRSVEVVGWVAVADAAVGWGGSTDVHGIAWIALGVGAAIAVIGGVVAVSGARVGWAADRPPTAEGGDEASGSPARRA